MATTTDPPAIDGGRAVNAKPFPMWPSFDLAVMDDVKRILETGRASCRATHGRSA
jgi:hypothetical protein